MLMFAKGAGIFLVLAGIALLLGLSGSQFLISLPILLIVSALLAMVFSVEGLDSPGAKERGDKPPRTSA